ncbi:E1A-binding protein p400-like [Condylostylus longicornis]|uniref:E1A-binding protein p400-like n=1 Tax=Condylostylus longicornis TaxID=2530218 RepID=UPI00244DA42B|nr:E1A-binding protein p400-like [Condylostylus longicornis]
MDKKIKIFPVCLCLLLLQTSIIEARRIRTRPRPVEPVEEIESGEIESESVEDNRAQSAIQYYQAESRENIRNQPLAADDDYNGYYGQPAPAAPIAPIRASPRVDYRPPAPTRAPIPQARTKDASQNAKAAPVQTIRNYSKVNDDGSFTFGYEAADGSFKEETRGTDCVVRGKYGYIDPDGNKREFTYVSGNPCDPNNPDAQESDEERSQSSEEDSREPENLPQNYPRRPPVPRPVQHTTPHAPTTVFQNNYAQHSLNRGGSEEEEPEPIQVLQPQRPNRPSIQNFNNYVPQEITIRQRPKITVSPTPAPNFRLNNPSVSITPRPTYRPVTQSLQPQPPATTYRPTVIKASEQPATLTYSKSTPRPIGFSQSTPNAIPSVSRRPVDFNSELRKFQEKHNVPITTSTIRTTTQYRPESVKPLQNIPSLPATSTPLYETQLVYNPASGQYDSSIFQTIPHTDSEFTINQKIQPFVQQPQLVSLNQLQQINPIYRAQPAPLPQFSQQIYEKERENLQVLNSQQLFQQQQELQNQQLQKDRVEAARKAAQQHRFKAAPSPLPPQPQPIPEQQGFYYLQPSGQLEPYLGAHNINISY